MAETTQKKFTWRLFTGLFLLFAIGNLIFLNLLIPLVGFAALPMGVVVSGSMTLTVAFFVMRRRAGPAESIRV